MAEYLDHIKPGGEGPKIRDKKLSKWPLHHDPNFEALTYGETRSRGAYVKKLKNLNEGDLVAFYTGLRRKGDQNRRKHRYIIGYFTVNEAVNFERLNLEGREVSFRDLSPKRKRGLMEQHRNNAHAKRFKATGEIYGGDGLVIVDGKKPDGLLDTAFRISKFTDTGHYYLTDELQDAFSPEPSGRPERNAYLGGIKQAHTLNINPNDFMDIVDSNGA